MDVYFNAVRRSATNGFNGLWGGLPILIHTQTGAILNFDRQVENVETDLGSGLILWCPLLACYLSPESSLARPPASLLPEQIQEDSERMQKKQTVNHI